MAEVLCRHTSSGSSPSRQSTDSANVVDCDAEESGRGEERRDGDQLSFLALLFTIFRKSLVCRSDRRQFCSMDIGWPNEVRHVTHVTFDRFNGFLGLPVEFEPEVPRRAPSASARVFGVSTESMQLSYDSRGNIVPMILLLMQQSLYDGGGLQVEGIFRITGDNVQEEYIRDQLNRGVVPDGIDVHCLAGLIKAWFRELPSGVLDSVQPDRIIQCSTEEECAHLVKDLPQTEAYLLDWAINLMADVAQMEHFNKMNARNIAMVFAPNMTQMADPFTALMYAVQVMNFLKTLVARNLRLREAVIEAEQASIPEPFDENGHESPSKLFCISSEDNNWDDNEEEDSENAYVDEEPSLEEESLMGSDEHDSTVSHLPSFHSSSSAESSRVSVVSCVSEAKNVEESPKPPKGHLKIPHHHHHHLPLSDITSKQMEVAGAAMNSLSRIEMRMARIEAWR